MSQGMEAQEWDVPGVMVWHWRSRSPQGFGLFRHATSPPVLQPTEEDSHTVVVDDPAQTVLPGVHVMLYVQQAATTKDPFRIRPRSEAVSRASDSERGVRSTPYEVRRRLPELHGRRSRA